jgi:hypothetical protein
MNVHQKELTAHYSDVRKRLGMGMAAPKNITTVAIAAPVAAPVLRIVEKPRGPVVTPLCAVVDLYFDWHVRVWREAVERQISDLAHENVALRAALQVHRADLEMACMPRRPTKQIIAEVLENFPGISWEDIKSKSRTLDVTYPRQLCMYEVHTQRKDMSYPQIGRLFGGRDHTTALHSVRKIKAMTPEERRSAEVRWQELPRRRPMTKASIYATTRITELQATIG